MNKMNAEYSVRFLSTLSPDLKKSSQNLHSAQVRDTYPNTIASLWRFEFSLQAWGCLLLSIAVLISGFSLIYLKALQRDHMIGLQATQQHHDQLLSRWNQLQVEHSSWTSPARIQAIAQNNLGMVHPKMSDRIQIRTSGTLR